VWYVWVCCVCVMCVVCVGLLCVCDVCGVCVVCVCVWREVCVFIFFVKHAPLQSVILHAIFPLISLLFVL